VITCPTAQEECLSMEAVNSFLDIYFSKHFPASIVVNGYVIIQNGFQNGPVFTYITLRLTLNPVYLPLLLMDW
jgi:hypothetical protein